MTDSLFLLGLDYSAGPSCLDVDTIKNSEISHPSLIHYGKSTVENISFFFPVAGNDAGLCGNLAGTCV